MKSAWANTAGAIGRRVQTASSLLVRTMVRILLVARNAMALIGLVLVCFAIREATQITAPPPLPAATVEAAPSRPSAVRKRADSGGPTLARYVSRRYRVAQDAAEQIVADAYRTGRQVGLDPLVILAVIAVESGFNPLAQSEAGAKGLMQIMPRAHASLLREHGGERVMLDPTTNIVVGARILKSYVSITGSVEAALQYYSGSGGTQTGEYSQKVLAERDRLQERLEVGQGLRTSVAVPARTS